MDMGDLTRRGDGARRVQGSRALERRHAAFDLARGSDGAGCGQPGATLEDRVEGRRGGDRARCRYGSGAHANRKADSRNACRRADSSRSLEDRVEGRASRNRARRTDRGGAETVALPDRSDGRCCRQRRAPLERLNADREQRDDVAGRGRRHLGEPRGGAGDPAERDAGVGDGGAGHRRGQGRDRGLLQEARQPAARNGGRGRALAAAVGRDRGAARARSSRAPAEAGSWSESCTGARMLPTGPWSRSSRGGRRPRCRCRSPSRPRSPRSR